MKRTRRGWFTTAWAGGAALIVFSTGVFVAPALAQNATWDPAVTTGGSWGNATNWLGGTPASGAANTATFGLDFSSGSSVTLDGNRTISTITTTSANPWSLNPGSSGI